VSTRIISAVLALFMLGSLGLASSAQAKHDQPTTQEQIDAFLAEHPDATQTGDYEVSWNNDAVVMVWPNESTGKVKPAQSENGQGKQGEGEVGTLDVEGCPSGYTVRNYYCFYEHSNWNGRMLKFADCGYLQRLTDYGFGNQTSSWVNTTGNSVSVRDVNASTGSITHLWTESSNSKSSYVGNANNDRADDFNPSCG
jgi:uncharacterized protein YidB (DUF937 family)